MRKILNLHNWIAELPQAIQAEVSSHLVERSLADTECLYRLGGPPDSCFQVARGKLKICTFNQAGQEFVHAYLMEGDCVGDWGLIINEPRMNFAFAYGDAVISVLQRAHFYELYEKHSEIPKALNRVMSRRLQLLFMLAEDASLLPLRQRLARAMLRSAHSGGDVDTDGCTTIDDISHDELGKMVGATRQSVSRELKKLEQEGAIQIRYGKILIMDIAAFSEQHDRLLSAEPIVPDYQDNT